MDVGYKSLSEKSYKNNCHPKNIFINIENSQNNLQQCLPLEVGKTKGIKEKEHIGQQKFQQHSNFGV